MDGNCLQVEESITGICTEYAVHRFVRSNKYINLYSYNIITYIHILSTITILYIQYIYSHLYI